MRRPARPRTSSRFRTPAEPAASPPAAPVGVPVAVLPHGLVKGVPATATSRKKPNVVHVPGRRATRTFSVAATGRWSSFDGRPARGHGHFAGRRTRACPRPRGAARGTLGDASEDPGRSSRNLIVSNPVTGLSIPHPRRPFVAMGRRSLRQYERKVARAADLAGCPFDGCRVVHSERRDLREPLFERHPELHTREV